MSFRRVANNISKLVEENAELATRLRKYVYPIVGCCQEVHAEMGPFLNEYIYQESLDLSLEEKGFKAQDRIKEYSFKAHFHGKELDHTHRVDFLINQNVIVECKAIEAIGKDQRQQLWNYMRLSGVPIGILYNFAPVYAECEKYYFESRTKTIYLF